VIVGVLASVAGWWVLAGAGGDGPGRRAAGDRSGIGEVAGEAADDPADEAAGVLAYRLPIAEPGVEGTILRLFLATGTDPPDQDALDGWVGRYRDGEPLAGIGEAFAGGEQSTARYGRLDDDAFVDRLYRDVLGRAPSGDEAAHWAGRLAAGAGRGEPLLAVSESPEYVAATGTPAPSVPRPLLAAPGVEHSVARLYLGLVGTWPERAAFDASVRQYLDGAPLASVADAVLAGPAAARWGGTDDEAFVTALYREVLDQEVDAEALAAWTASLASGQPRGAVVVAFTESPGMQSRTRTAAPLPPPIPRKLLAVGDSVMLGAVAEIEATPGWTAAVDARGCRQPTWRGDGCGAVDIPSGVDALRAARSEGDLGGVVVIHLGNNGPMSAEQFDALMTEVADQRLVLALTLHEPRSYEAGNNAVITGAVQRWPNLRVVDWHTAAASHPEWFGDGEGIHLSDAGARAMADLIAAELPQG
jgi:hypothetical protein